MSCLQVGSLGGRWPTGSFLLLAAAACARSLCKRPASARTGCFAIGAAARLPARPAGEAATKAAQRLGSASRSPLVGSDSETTGWWAAVGLVCGLASRLRLRAGYGGGRFGGGGGGFRGGGYGNQAEFAEQAREAKRSREASQFFTYQKRLLRMGVPPRDELYWRREEALLFGGTKMSQGINFDNYDEVEVETRGGRGREEPVASFQACAEQFNLPSALAMNLEKCQYSKPTPVQKYSMPAALQSTDVMVAAQTGSGKTAAFLVPVISGTLQEGTYDLTEGPVRPRSVVLSPTRELCQQISTEARKLCFRSDVRVVSVYGGADAMPQLKALAEGCELVIATPGRLEDFLGRGVMTMESVKYLVLDEADRMLDMGFEPQIRQIIDAHGMPHPGQDANSRQTMMFSATFPKEIQSLALDFLDPTYLWIGVGRVGSANADVEQRFADVSTIDEEDKFATLLDSVGEVKKPDGRSGKTLVFANSKSVVDDLAWRLSDNRVRSTQIHGGLTQAARDRALGDFKNGRVGVLVATDVAARGLDLPGIDHVINYELPLNAEDYVHRIGRTGRIGNTGVATSFISQWEPALKDIVKSIKMEQKEMKKVKSPLPSWVEDQAMQNSGGSSNRFGRGSRGGRGGSAPPRGDRYGGNRFGNDRYGGRDDRFGNDRYGGGDRFGDRSGGRGRYSDNSMGGDRWGAERFGGRGGKGGGRGRGDDAPPWARSLPSRNRERF